MPDEYGNPQTVDELINIIKADLIEYGDVQSLQEVATLLHCEWLDEIVSFGSTVDEVAARIITKQ